MTNGETTGDAPARRLPAAMRRVEPLRGVLPNRILSSAFQWSGVTRRQLVGLLNESSQRVASDLAVLVDAGLLDTVPVWVMRGGRLVSVKEPEAKHEVVEQFHMHYGSDHAATYVAHLDAIKLGRVRGRVHDDIRGDHNEDRPKLRHTLQLHDCMVALTKGGYRVSAGYRGCLYLPGAQAVPDFRMLARIFLGEYPTEFVPDLFVLRHGPSAVGVRPEVRSMLEEYAPLVEDFQRLLIVCQIGVVVDLVREEAKALGIPVLAVLERRVVVGDPVGGRALIVRPLFVDPGHLWGVREVRHNPSGDSRQAHGVFSSRPGGG